MREISLTFICHRFCPIHSHLFYNKCDQYLSINREFIIHLGISFGMAETANKYANILFDYELNGFARKQH